MQCLHKKCRPNIRTISTTNSRPLRFERVSHILDSWVKAGPYPGIVAGIYDDTGELFFHAVNKESKIHTDFHRDTIYRWYSMTKPFTAAAIMILVERGVLSLEDEISQWIPEYATTRVYTGGKSPEDYQSEALAQPIRIKHLLNHTAGIPAVYFGQQIPELVIRKNFSGVCFTTGYRELTIDKICGVLAKGPLCNQPGSGFEYGLSYEVLGHIVEIVAKMRLDEFMKKELFIPLGMVDTDFYVPAEKIHRLASFGQLLPGHLFENQTRLKEKVRHVNAAFFSGSFGLNGTLADYGRFARMLMNGGELDGVRVLQPATVAAMTSNQLPDNKNVDELNKSRGVLEIDAGGFGYGYGVSVLTRPDVALGGELSSKGEFGWGGLAYTWFYVDPVRKYYFICMAQLLPSNTYPLRAQLRYATTLAMQESEE